MTDIKYDLSQFYPMKAVVEQTLGKCAYLKLKETATLSDWKREMKKLISAIELSINETVKIADEDFFAEVKQIIDTGHSYIQGAKDIADLFSYLSATLTRLVFLQIGYVPNRCHLKSVPLIKRNWVLSGVRSVQYVQSEEQREAAQKIKEMRASASIAINTPCHPVV